MDISATALGQVIRDLRRQAGLTQEALGAAAGYQGGAGVTVSRIESGRLEPSQDRLDGIASALGLTSTELLGLATERAASESESAERGVTSFDQRIGAIQAVNERRDGLNAAYDRFTHAGTAADRAFLAPFRELAARMIGIEVGGALRADFEDEAEADTRDEASYQLRLTTFGVKEVLARSGQIDAASDLSFDSFASAVALSTVAAGAAISAPSVTLAARSLGTALTVATSMRRAASTSGFAIAGGLVGGALVAALTASGAKRTKKQQLALEEALVKIEEEISETQPSLDALLEVLPLATETLEYIAVHAGHALSRWGLAGASGRIDWRDLGELDRSRFETFADIAAAQLAVQTIDIRGLVESRGLELEHSRSLVMELLNQSRERISRQV